MKRQGNTGQLSDHALLSRRSSFGPDKEYNDGFPGASSRDTRRSLYCRPVQWEYSSVVLGRQGRHLAKPSATLRSDAGHIGPPRRASPRVCGASVGRCGPLMACSADRVMATCMMPASEWDYRFGICSAYRCYFSSNS